MNTKIKLCFHAPHMLNSNIFRINIYALRCFLKMLLTRPGMLFWYRKGQGTMLTQLWWLWSDWCKKTYFCLYPSLFRYLETYFPNFNDILQHSLILIATSNAKPTTVKFTNQILFYFIKKKYVNFWLLQIQIKPSVQVSWLLVIW